MLRNLLKSKIHNAAVTGTRVDYVGSITIDKALMEASGIIQYEKVLVSDITNGARFETYVLEGAGGVVEVNGAAAKLVKEHDRIIVMAFGLFDESEAKRHKPRIVVVDGRNKVTSLLP
jgi:aspartate 1-decarboxylase